MLQFITLSLALASLAASQINPNTVSPILPSVTVNTSALTSTTATIDGTATTLACIPESEIVFSIQTDTIIGNEPASTPVCGQSTTVLPGGPIVNLTTTTATTAATVNGTLLSTTATLTSIATGESETSGSGSGTGTGTGTGTASAPAETSSGSSAATMAVGGGVAGVLGLAAGMMFL